LNNNYELEFSLGSPQNHCISEKEDWNFSNYGIRDLNDLNEFIPKHEKCKKLKQSQMSVLDWLETEPTKRAFHVPSKVR